MASGFNHVHGRGRLYQFSISLLILMISSSSHLSLFKAEGRTLPHTSDKSQMVKEEKIILRGQIGSRPPRCELRCGSCAHCEAIQVPTNPQISKGGIKNSTFKSSFSVSAYTRGDDSSSNYKPMSWKCKCGNLIFNP